MQITFAPPLMFAEHLKQCTKPRRLQHSQEVHEKRGRLVCSFEASCSALRAIYGTLTIAFSMMSHTQESFMPVQTRFMSAAFILELNVVISDLSVWCNRYLLVGYIAQNTNEYSLKFIHSFYYNMSLENVMMSHPELVDFYLFFLATHSLKFICKQMFYILTINIASPLWIFVLPLNPFTGHCC